MPFQFADYFILLFFPGCTFTVIKFLVYIAVKLVVIHGVQPVLQLIILGLESSYFPVMVLFLISMAFLESGDHPVQHLIV
ncbi:MAG: hypothetical protein ACQES8_06200 [Thermodesulfobacteriota bacterium]